MSVKSLTSVPAKMWFGASLVALAASLNMTVSPEVLTAAHTVHVAGISNAKIVETVVPEPVVTEPVITPAKTTKVVSPQVTFAQPEPIVIETGPRVLTISGVRHSMTMQVEPGNSIWRMGKLYYGHNSPEILGELLEIVEGDVLSIEGRQYRVMAKTVYAKTELENNPGVKNPRGNLMSDVTFDAYNAHNGVTYDIAVMTCEERALDAAHRRVVYANLM